MVLIDARFIVVARRSVRGAPLKAATIGLWPVDDFHRTLKGITEIAAAGIHEVCTIIRRSRSRRRHGSATDLSHKC
jgi:hypothetical protein